MTARGAWIASGIAGLALALRVGWIVYSWQQHGAALAYPDEDLHWQLARNLIAHGALVTDDGRCAARMPLYPLCLAYFALFGDAGVLLARLGQALLGAGTAVLAWRIGRSAFDVGVGVGAGLLVACDPFGIFFTNLLLTETLFTFLAVAFIGLAWRYLFRPEQRSGLIGIALLGPLLILTRPSAAGWLPLAWIGLVILSPNRRRAAIELFVLCPLVFAATLLPWGLRNHARIGGFAWLSANGGITLYDAQGPQADGSSDQSFAADIPELAQLSELEQDKLFRDLAWQQMRADPWRVLWLAKAKFLRTWNPFPNVEEHRSGSAAYAGAAYTIIVLLAASVGLVRAFLFRPHAYQHTFWRIVPGPRSAHALLWLPIVYFTLVHCIYIGSVRYRVPLMPPLAIAAASALNRKRAAPQP